MNKIEKEKQISELMIKLYCNKNHNTKKSLCQQCETLKDYTFKRIDRQKLFAVVVKLIVIKGIWLNK